MFRTPSTFFLGPFDALLATSGPFLLTRRQDGEAQTDLVAAMSLLGRDSRLCNAFMVSSYAARTSAMKLPASLVSCFA
jgi:hypothetical protein